ncbi:hypothetical protein [Sorangium cellulosum]|uniref:hypothetical protein n=1 Tax=Sorangium cellulosum TaxID=56 RepID=UPI001E520BFB|nr:hypothetical protein [Sorangium cellulosum]
MKRAPGGTGVYRSGINGITLRVADRAHPIGRRGVAMRMNLLPGRGHWLLALALSLTAACGTAPGAESPAREDIFRAAGPNEFILLTAQGELVSADIEPGRVVGPDVNLGVYAADRGRDGQTVRGVAFNRTVNVTTTGQRAAGIVGAMPLELSVTRAEAGLRAQGLLAGALSDYRLDERQLTGTIGRCSYALTRTGRTYEGSRRCEGPPHHATVLLPRGLSSWSDAALAAALGLLLGA